MPGRLQSLLLPQDQAPNATWTASLQLTAVRSIQVLETAVLEGIRRGLFRSVQNAETQAGIKRIVVFRVGNVGDIVVTIPLLSSLRRRFPHAYICLLTSPGQPGRPGAKDILTSRDWVDEIVSYDVTDLRTWSGCKGLLRRLHEGHFDLFIELPQTFTPFSRALRHLVVARLIGVNSVAGIQTRHRMIFARAQALHRRWKSEADELYDLVGDTLQLKRLQQVRLPLPDDARCLIARRLAEFGIRANTPFIAVQVGAKRSTNRWLPERFAEVIDFLQQVNELPVVLIGAASDSAAIQEVTSRMTTPVHTLVGKTTLLETAALLERSVLYIGNDTGPMHLAAAVGTPTVSVFSARDYPVLWFPAGDSHVVLRSDVPCSPCFKETCDRSLLCLARIATNDVRDAAEGQLVRSGIFTAARSHRRRYGNHAVSGSNEQAFAP